MRRLLESRPETSLILSLCGGAVLLYVAPFPSGNWLLGLILVNKPWIFYALSGLYHLLLFATLFFLLSACLSLAYILIPRERRNQALAVLPPIPEGTGELSITVGEVHNERTPEPSNNPRWLIVPERGLFTGVAIIGAIGSGKTSCCMYPFASQFSLSEIQADISGVWFSK